MASGTDRVERTDLERIAKEIGEFGLPVIKAMFLPNGQSDSLETLRFGLVPLLSYAVC